MKTFALALIAGAAIFATPSFAQDATKIPPDLIQLGKDIDARLAEAQARLAETGTPPYPTTFQVVAPEDIAIGSNKWNGKGVELRNVRCYFADAEDYRCITNVNAVVFTENVANDDGRKYVEENCDTLKKAFASSRCTVTIRFRYENAASDIMNGYQRRIVVRPDTIAVVLGKKR